MRRRKGDACFLWNIERKKQGTVEVGFGQRPFKTEAFYVVREMKEPIKQGLSTCWVVGMVQNFVFTMCFGCSKHRNVVDISRKRFESFEETQEKQSKFYVQL